MLTCVPVDLMEMSHFLKFAVDLPIGNGGTLISPRLLAFAVPEMQGPSQ
jgi:hypothetical protein